MTKWKTEEKVRSIMEKMFGEPFESYRPDFLKSPKTGRNLELDGYNHRLKLAFERQGEQHYEYIEGKSLFKSEEEWKNQIKRDRYKRKVCKLVGITLIIIPPQYTSDKDIFKCIIKQLPSNMKYETPKF